MAQGWNINATTDKIDFLEAPPTGTNNVLVKEFASGAIGGTDAFALGAWSGEFGWPSEIEFFADRLWFAGTPTDPQLIWGTQIADYSNFGKSTPIVDSDAVSFAINARQVNAVMDLVPLDKMIVLAKGGEFLMSGGQDDVITPSTISIKPQSYRGTGGLQAEVVGDTAIFVQEQGQRVYDIGYRFEADGYKPQDISVWAAHLVAGYELQRMRWMPGPWSVIWFVRNDGVQLGCTYMPEQEVIGWHRHDSGRNVNGDGSDAIEDIVSLPGSTQSELFAVVKRTVNGVTKRYIEQLAPDFVADELDFHYVDSGLVYDGRNTTAKTMTLTGGVNWNDEEALALVASASTFSNPGDIGDAVKLEITVSETDPNTGVASDVTYAISVQITEYTSPGQVVVTPTGVVPEALRGVPTSTWTFQRDTISGLDHLEGREVAILSDANVHQKLVVTDGAITLSQPGGVVHVGLPYRAHIETLEVNNPGGAGVRDAKKLLTSVGLLVQSTRGIKACGGTLRDEYTYELPQREFEDWGTPTQPTTGYVEIPVSAEWGENNGHGHIISDDPLPMTILAIVPRVMVSDRVA